MDREKYLAYNRLVNNINPLHSDQGYARKLGFEDIVVAGVFTFSFIPQMIEEWAGGSSIIRCVEIKYLSPVYIEAAIVHKALVRSKFVKDGIRRLELEVWVEDSQGNRLTEARVTVEFP